MMTQGEREEFESAKAAIATARDSAQRECEVIEQAIVDHRQQIELQQHNLAVAAARMLAFSASLKALQGVIAHEPAEPYIHASPSSTD